MPLLTIDLPDAEYRAALTLPQGELRRIVTDGVNEYATARNESDYDDPTTEQDLIDIGEGLRAIAEGRVISSDVLFAELKAGIRSK